MNITETSHTGHDTTIPNNWTTMGFTNPETGEAMWVVRNTTTGQDFAMRRGEARAKEYADVLNRYDLQGLPTEEARLAAFWAEYKELSATFTDAKDHAAVVMMLWRMHEHETPRRVVMYIVDRARAELDQRTKGSINPVGDITTTEVIN